MGRRTAPVKAPAPSYEDLLRMLDEQGQQLASVRKQRDLYQQQLESARRQYSQVRAAEALEST